MVDRKDDLLAGIKSTAVLFGDDDKVIIGILQLLFIVVMALIGDQIEMGIVYYLALLITAGLFVYQQVLVKNRDAAQCLQAFLNNNWVGAVLFFGIVLHYAVK
jgi:4-hydroxybenzoate polyprenyltransferase